MTKKEFENLQLNEFIFKGKRKARIIGRGSDYLEFVFLDTQRKSCRGYRGLKLAKPNDDIEMAFSGSTERKV